MTVVSLLRKTVTGETSGPAYQAQDYRSRNPVEGLPNAPGAPDGEIDLDSLMGGDDDDDVHMFAARQAAAAGEAGPAPASAPALAPAPADDDSAGARTVSRYLETLQWQGLGMNILTQMHAFVLYG